MFIYFFFLLFLNILGSDPTLGTHLIPSKLYGSGHMLESDRKPMVEIYINANDTGLGHVCVFLFYSILMLLILT